MILIDADSLVYSCGFACQKSSHALVAENAEGDLREDITANLRDWKRDNPGWSIIEKTATVDPQPEAFAVHSLRLALSNIIARCGNTAYTMFITGSGNFREKIATILPYKGNRDKLHKPYHYAALRTYLRNEGAILVDGMEADDQVSITARAVTKLKRKPVVIASIDKDLNQIPGRHYNPTNEEFYDVTDEEATRWLRRQMLSGDPTDNIGGVWKMGPTKADRYLDTVYAAGKAWWKSIVAAYDASRAIPGCPYEDMNPEEAALENARLVFMLHTVEQATKYWSPK